MMPATAVCAVHVVSALQCSLKCASITLPRQSSDSNDCDAVCWHLDSSLGNCRKRDAPPWCWQQKAILITVMLHKAKTLLCCAPVSLCGWKGRMTCGASDVHTLRACQIHKVQLAHFDALHHFTTTGLAILHSPHTCSSISHVLCLSRC